MQDGKRKCTDDIGAMEIETIPDEPAKKYLDSQPNWNKINNNEYYYCCPIYPGGSWGITVNKFDLRIGFIKPPFSPSTPNNTVSADMNEESVTIGMDTNTEGKEVFDFLPPSEWSDIDMNYHIMLTRTTTGNITICGCKLDHHPVIDEDFHETRIKDNPLYPYINITNGSLKLDNFKYLVIPKQCKSANWSCKRQKK